MARNRSLIALGTAEIVSNLGSRMTWLALPWFVLVTTGSATKMGIVFAVEAVPMAVLGIPSGAVVQRFGARSTMLACDLVRAPLLALVPLLHALGALPFGVLLALVFTAGVFTAPYFASQRLVLPEVVGEDERSVMRANSLIEGAQRLTGLAGPAAAGALISVLGAANVVWIDAATYAIAFALIALCVPRRAATPEAEEGRGLLAGLRFVRRDPVLGPLALEILLIGLFVPLLFAGLPLLAFERYGRSALVAGALASAWSGGALLGALAAYRVAPRYSPLRMASLAAPWFALPIWTLAFAIPPWVAVAALAVSGFAVPFVNAPIITLLTVRTPPALRGKVMTTTSAAEMAAAPLGYALAGPVFAALGLGGAYALVAAGLTAGVALLVAILPTSRSSRLARRRFRQSARPRSATRRRCCRSAGPGADPFQGDSRRGSLAR
jgi:Major Facilitator Superfamily